MYVDFESFGQKRKKQKQKLKFQRKERSDIHIAMLSTKRKCNALMSLTLCASLDFNTRLIREIRTSQNGGAFKIWIALRRTL
jgi:hypothetical protein